MEVGAGKGSTAPPSYIQGLVAVEVMQYTCGRQFGLAKHGHVCSYVRHHPLEVLLLFNVVHAPDIPYTNSCRPPPLPLLRCVVWGG